MKTALSSNSEATAGGASPSNAATESVREAALFAEKTLAVDWNRPEENLAWGHLRPSSPVNFSREVSRCRSIH